MAAPRSPRTIDRQSFDQFQTLLKELPPKPKEKFTIVEVAQELKPFIQSAILEKGYSPKELTTILKEKTGKTISVRQIKQVLQETAEPAPKRRTYNRKKAVAPTEASTNGHSDPTAVVEAPAIEKAPKSISEPAVEEAKPKRTRGTGRGSAASKKTAATPRKTSSRTTTAKKTPAKRAPRGSKK